MRGVQFVQPLERTSGCFEEMIFGMGNDIKYDDRKPHFVCFAGLSFQFNLSCIESSITR